MLSFLSVGWGQTVQLSNLGKDSLSIEKFTQIFVDSNKSFKVEELSSDQFQSYQGFIETADLKKELDGYIWLWIELSNNSLDTIQFVFYPGLFNEVIFHEKTHEGWEPKVNGYYTSKNKSLHPLACVYPTRILPGETSTIITRVEGRFTKGNCEMDLYNPIYLDLHPPIELERILSSTFFSDVLFWSSSFCDHFFFCSICSSQRESLFTLFNLLSSSFPLLFEGVREVYS